MFMLLGLVISEFQVLRNEKELVFDYYLVIAAQMTNW